MFVPFQFSQPMITEGMADIALCLVITKILLAAWALLSAAEWFANLHLFRSDGLLTRNILRLRPRLVVPAFIRHRVHAESTVIAILMCRIVAGLLLLIPYPNYADLPCSLLILLSCFYMSRRTWFGGDGSDQMGMVIAAGAAIISAGLVLDDINVAASGVFAISGQAVLAYFVAGAAKIVSPIWRDGMHCLV